MKCGDEQTALDRMRCQSRMAKLSCLVQGKCWKEQGNDAKVSSTGKLLSEECREVEGSQSGQGVLLRAQPGASRGSKLNKVPWPQGGSADKTEAGWTSGSLQLKSKTRNPSWIPLYLFHFPAK